MAHWGWSLLLQVGVAQPTGPYQGALQEEYRRHARVDVERQPAVPAAAAEAALGLRVQVEPGAQAAILPALLSRISQPLLQRKAGCAPDTTQEGRTCDLARPCRGGASPSAGRTRSALQGSARRHCGSGSACAPSVAGERSGSSSPQRSTPGAVLMVGSPRRTPSLWATPGPASPSVAGAGGLDWPERGPRRSVPFLLPREVWSHCHLPALGLTACVTDREGTPSQPHS